MRVAVDWRSSSKDEYNKFCKKYPNVKLTIDEWKNIIYNFNESFKTYILETGNKAKLPHGFGEVSIAKKLRKRVKILPDGREVVNLPINWKKTKEKGKYVYDFNYHTEGYHFRWMWFKKSTRISNSDLWYFRPTRVTSRLLAHYIKTDKKYQNLYHRWKI